MLFPPAIEDLIRLMFWLQRDRHAEIDIANVLVHVALAVHIDVEPRYACITRGGSVAVGYVLCGSDKVDLNICGAAFELCANLQAHLCAIALSDPIWAFGVQIVGYREVFVENVFVVGHISSAEDDAF